MAMKTVTVVRTYSLLTRLPRGPVVGCGVRKHLPDVARSDANTHPDANTDADAYTDADTDTDAHTHSHTDADAVTDAVTRGAGDNHVHQPEPGAVDKRCRRWL